MHQLIFTALFFMNFLNYITYCIQSTYLFRTNIQSMPPKKKQEQIDLSTLPECKSLNIFLLCKGRQERAKKILAKIDSKFDKMIFHVKRAAVLDHAKQKGIYVDPQSLTDKQKKDPKFMQTVCTQLTPQVLAKATDSYINNQNVKIRLEKKILLEKPETAEIEKKKNIDCLYVFDDFPTEAMDFEALATANQGVKFVFVVDPKITWASAPQEPEPAQNPDEEPNEPDEQYQQFKKMKQAETLTPQDQKHEKSIEEHINKLRNERKKSSNGSLFRNTVIQYIKCNIDPYTEDASIQQVTNLILPTCEQLLQSSVQFNAWKKDKHAEKLPEKQAGSLSTSQIKIQNQSVDKTMQVLSSLLQKFKPAGAQQKNKDEHVDFSDFSFDVAPALPQDNNKGNQKPASTEYLSYNEQKQKEERDFIKQILKNTRYPGIDRFMMPQLPVKSEGLRKKYRSSFGQFLPAGLSFQDFERKMNILYLESAAKEADEQRTYDFSNKIYEEQHTRESLIRQLNKAMLFDQSTVTVKYNQNNDKLYLCLLYKNPARRMSKKVWECNWKVLPNLENWLKYFRDNQTNLNNTQYYDIDYELIGNVQEEANVWTAKDSGVIVRRKSTVAGQNNTMLYCLSGVNTGDLIFGLRNRGQGSEFYAQNQIALITQTHNANDKTKSIFVTFKDGSIIQFTQNGDTIIRKNECKTRLITREGYTIIYGVDKKNTILHPNGGITRAAGSYVNPSGRGLNHGRLHQVSTLKKYTESGQLVTKRDDSTVIVEEKDKKWIKFEDNTEYLHLNNQLTIQKADYPIFKVLSNNKISVNYNGLQISSEKTEIGFTFNIKFTRICTNNGSQLVFSPKNIQVFDGKTQTPYTCTIDEPSISKNWEDQSITVTFNGSKYQRNPKRIVDPEEDEENFNEEDVLKGDYIQPRVFVIGNDNTGVELLSDNQLQKGYFEIFEKNKSRNPNEVKRSEVRQIAHPEAQNKSIVFGVVPIPQTAFLNKKTIEHISVDLDVFKNNPSAQNHQSQNNLLQVRSIIKHQKLTKEDRETIASILSKRAEHQARSEKQDNQYGYKPKNDLSTKERYQSKRKVIQFRKLKEQQVLCDAMKNEAVKLYDKESQDRIQRIENINKELQIRKKLSKKKSLVIQYNWKEPPMMEEDENLQFYNQVNSFYTNYFQTAEGKKALSQMPQWVFRPKQNKQKQELDPQIQSQLNATMNKTKKQQELMNATNQKLSYKQESQRNQRYDTVEPELRPSPLIYIKPSVFTQREIDEERFAFEGQKKAYEYHERKRKDFDVYGKDRKEKMEVPSLMRTQPVSQLNQKYLVTEAPVDKKVKISSMKNKLTSEASNMTQMRKQGPHANLIRTIDKGNDYSKLLEKRTMMVQADLNDRLQRDIQINPIEANFGLVKQGGNYELKIEIKNEDVLAQRINLKKPKSIFCKVQMVEMGPIALGMTRKVSVLLKAAPEITGRFTDEFDIVTKHEVYHIPIIAQILSKNQFESSGAMLSRSIREFEQIGKKKREELPPIKGNQ